MLNDSNELLLAEEFHFDMFMRKFPGGGLQFGEGPEDALRRELKEELDIEVQIGRHLHTTDIFIPSVFNADHQVLGIYYEVAVPPGLEARFRDLNRNNWKNGDVTFNWKSLDEIRSADLTFPMDIRALEVFLGSLH